MMRIVIAFLSGAVFALGLIISDMANPARVLAFLDVAGEWDPTLAFVMIGAIAVMARAWPRMRRQGSGVYGGVVSPASGGVDRRLLGGSVLFGVGWGLAGFCPGPALTALSFGGAQAWILTVAMLAGMLCYRLVKR